MLEELDRQEDRSQTPFELDSGAFAHFARLIGRGRTLH